MFPVSFLQLTTAAEQLLQNSFHENNCGSIDPPTSCVSLLWRCGSEETLSRSTCCSCCFHILSRAAGGTWRWGSSSRSSGRRSFSPTLTGGDNTERLHLSGAERLQKIIKLQYFFCSFMSSVSFAESEHLLAKRNSHSWKHASVCCTQRSLIMLPTLAPRRLL